jgi:hypothetical protein
LGLFLPQPRTVLIRTWDSEKVLDRSLTVRYSPATLQLIAPLTDGGAGNGSLAMHLHYLCAFSK